MTAERFRPMTVADVEDVLDIEHSVYHAPHDKHFYFEELQNASARYLVLTHGAHIVGYVGYWLVLDECSIVIIGVHPAWQRRGFGRKLLRRVLTDAARDGATFSTLEVRDTNLAAIQLYQSFGYTVVGRRKDYYKSTGDDALLMTLDPIS